MGNFARNALETWKNRPEKRPFYGPLLLVEVDCEKLAHGQVWP
jgi:hypothetical protein